MNANYNKVSLELNKIMSEFGMQPRPYQVEAIASLDDFFDKDPSLNPLLWLATGLGKTVIFSMLIRLYFWRYSGLRVLITAGNKELVSQAEQKIYSVFPKAPIGVFCSSLGRKEINEITIASRGSIANNLNKIGHIDFMIVDECDEIPEADSSQYKKIINGLREYNPHLKVIGLTATPYWSKDVIYKNGSKKDDKKIFDAVAYKKDLRWGIENGFLVKPITRVVSAESELNTDLIKIKGNEFDQTELEKAATQDALIRGACAEWNKEALSKGRLLTVFFCVSVKHAELVSEELKKYGIDAPVISGDTPQKERDNVLQQMRDGLLTAVCNVNVLTRGTDIPNIDALAILTATNSLRKIIQIVGRGLRLSPDTGKDNCLVLDFGGNTKRFGTLDRAMPPKPKNEEPRVKPCKKCHALVSIFAVRCEHCNEQLKPSPSKVCSNCEEPNSLGAKQCCNCGNVFLNHAIKAANRDIISSSELIREFTVDSVNCQVSINKKGKSYLKVCFWSERFNVYFKNLYFGGSEHLKACAEWRSLTKGMFANSPQTAEQALHLIESGQEKFKTISMVQVDMGSPFKTVLDYKIED